MVNRDTAFIQQEARKQAEAGAHYIDVNAGTLLEGEPEALEWLVTTVQEVVALPLSLDSPRRAALERALRVHRGRPIINSITAERERFSSLLPLVVEYNCRVIALCMDDEGVPRTGVRRMEIGSRLVEELTGAGVAPDDIFLDPCVMPVSVSEENVEPPGVVVYDCLRQLRESFPGVHLSAGLSNVSFGLPKRKLINQAACLVFMAAGLDAAILDPTDARLMSLIAAAEAVLGRDEFCMNYLALSREERLVV